MNDRGRPEAAHGAAAAHHTAGPGFDQKRRSAPFERFNSALVHCSPAFRCDVEAHCESTAGDWALLALECRDRADAYTYEPLDPEPRKRRKPLRGTPTSTSTGTDRVQVDRDDPLKRIPASEYLSVLAGIEVSSNGRCRCPMPDHEDLHPSCKVYDTVLWHCFGCNEYGDIIKLAEAIYGIPARGRDYFRLRDRIVEAMLWAPIGRGEGR